MMYMMQKIGTNGGGQFAVEKGPRWENPKEKESNEFNYADIYIIREESPIFAPQRLRFYMALGVAANTIGKVIASTVFMCVCSMFRPSDFLLFVKNGFVVGARTLNVTAGHCKNAVGSYEYPHCASVTRRLALDNRTYPAQLGNTTHTHTHTHDVGLR